MTGTDFNAIVESMVSEAVAEHKARIAELEAENARLVDRVDSLAGVVRTFKKVAENYLKEPTAETLAQQPAEAPELFDAAKEQRRANSSKGGLASAKRKRILTDAQVVEFRERFHINREHSIDIWRDAGEPMSQTTFSDMLRGKTYKHVPMPDYVLTDEERLEMQKSAAQRSNAARRKLSDAEVAEARRLYHVEGLALEDVQREIKADCRLKTLEHAVKGRHYQHVPMPAPTAKAEAAHANRLAANRKKAAQASGRATRELTDAEVVEYRRQYHIEGWTDTEVLLRAGEPLAPTAFTRMLKGYSYQHVPMPEAEPGPLQQAKFTDEQVKQYRERYHGGTESQREIMLDVGLDPEKDNSRFSIMLTGNSYKNVPMPKVLRVNGKKPAGLKPNIKAPAVKKVTAEPPAVMFPDSVPDDKAKVEVPQPKVEPVILNPAAILQEQGWEGVLASAQSEYLFKKLGVRNISYQDRKGIISASNIGRVILHAVVPGATKNEYGWGGHVHGGDASYSQLIGRMAFGLKAAFGADHANSAEYAFWLFRQLSGVTRRPLAETSRFWDGIEVKPGANAMSAIATCLKAWFGDAWYNTVMEYDTPVK